MREHEGATVQGDRRADTVEGSDRLGPYAVVGRLGAGGMGEVLEVRDSRLEREIAAKVIRGRADRVARSMFIREAQITGQLEHPNIVSVHDLDIDQDGQLFYTMQRIRGQSLESVLRDPPSIVALLRVFLKVCDGVALAHSRGVIHRDLKPANVMVGEFGEVLIVDWGLAKRVDSGDDAPEAGREGGARATSVPALTQDGDIVGTPAYMAPEQARGESSRIDPRADIYALGAILYHLLTGAAPFEGTVSSVLDQVRAGRWVPPIERAPERQVPWELDAVVRKAMALEPDARYASVRALERDVDAFIEGRMLQAARYSPRQRVIRWLRAHRWRLGLGAALLLATVAVVVAWAESQRLVRSEHGRRTAREDARREAQRATHEERRRQLQELLKRLVGEVESARLTSYIPRIDYRARLSAVKQAIGRIERLTRDPFHGADPEPWRMLGEAWAFVGDDRRAEAALTRAVAVGAPERSVARSLGRVYLNRAMCALLSDGGGDQPDHVRRARRWLTEAERWLAAAPAGAAHALETDVLAAHRRLAGNRRDEAMRLAREGLRRHGERPGVEQLWTVLAWVAPEPEAAVACDRALERRPHHAWAYFLRATRQPADDPAARRRDLDQAIRANPYFVEALINRAALHRRAGDHAAALRDAARAVELAPDHGIAYLNRGNARRALGDLKGAIVDYGLAVRHHPGLALALANRGSARAEQGDLAAALADLDRAIALDPQAAAAHDSRGSVRARRGDLRGALRDHGKAIALAPRRAEYHAHRGNARRQAGDVAGAVGDYDRALALDPRAPMPLHNRGLCRLTLGQPRAALADLDRALELTSADPALFTSRARIRQALGDLAGALADHDRAVALGPRRAVAYNARGLTRLAHGDRAGALADYGRALALDPDQLEARVNRGNARRLAGDLAGALADLERASRVAPGRWKVWANRAMAEIAAGRREAAQRSLRRALALDPGRARGQLEDLLRRVGG